MHENELDIDEALVRQLLRGPFPQWAALPLTEVPRAGTDNALYRLGDELVVRLPRIDWAATQAEREARWLPFLAPHLPLPIPVPVATGEPAEDYPWRWSVCPWLPGENPAPDNLTDLRRAALDIAGFVRALWTIDAGLGPRASRENFGRGGLLSVRDQAFRKGLPEWQGEFDTGLLLRLWEQALEAGEWDGEPAWVHGDLHAGNMLASGGRISGVIDFGTMGVGDPAVDLLPAWYVLDAGSRPVYREALGLDEAAWRRGIGWAISMAVGTLPYYRDTNRVLVGYARRALREVAGEFGAANAGA